MIYCPTLFVWFGFTVELLSTLSFQCPIMAVTILVTMDVNRSSVLKFKKSDLDFFFGPQVNEKGSDVLLFLSFQEPLDAAHGKGLQNSRCLSLRVTKHSSRLLVH
eukprot:TRINITY_DN98377_c0_g1_i1.p1 TRINITY_DN98377_c0_g1~~TRINITY_DN98377_c0_g1_i1.p1  ORF type:complete len:105 (-),score=7.55 TRINITY_DN98377_c0_g1_i1:147-461(-)